MDFRNYVKQLLKNCGHAFLVTVHERLDVLERQADRLNAQNLSLAETQTATLQASIHIVESLKQIGEVLAGQVSVETGDYEFTNPETGLMDHLYSYLPTRGAIDVGAHAGDVSECLLRSGYEVYAFEPFQPVYEKLVGRLGEHRGFHPFNFALGSDDGEMRLHLAQDLSGSGKYGDATVFNSLAAHSMPDDLPFVSYSTVRVRSLANLHREGVIPADIGLVKIDTEGFDLEVIRGMDDFRYPVVCAEFWDTEIPFGRSGLRYTLDGLIREMKELGYVWHIVLYRVWGRNLTAHYCNHHRPVPNSWGNVFFFRDYGLFSQGQTWCSAVLPRTFFKAVPVT